MIYVDIKDTKNKYNIFNGLPCKVMNWKRSDGLVDVEIPSLEIFILLEPSQIRSDVDE